MQNIFSVKTFRFRSKKWAAYASHSLIGDMFHYIFYFCYVLTIQVNCMAYSSIGSMQQRFSVKILVFVRKGIAEKVSYVLQDQSHSLIGDVFRQIMPIMAFIPNCSFKIFGEYIYLPSTSSLPPWQLWWRPLTPSQWPWPQWDRFSGHRWKIRKSLVRAPKHRLRGRVRIGTQHPGSNGCK